MATRGATVEAGENPRGFRGHGGAGGAAPILQTGFEMDPVVSNSRRFGWWILVSALTLTVLEGAIRKWVIGSAYQMGSYLAYFSKDIVFILLPLVPAWRASSGALEVFRRWLIAGSFFLVCGVLSSITRDINLAGAVLTLRAALILPVLAFIAV